MIKYNINNSIFLIISIIISLLLNSCSGIQIQNSKQASIEELTKGEVMIFVCEEKNKYENAYGYNVWNIKSEKGNLLYKDYVLSNIKKYVESLLVLNQYCLDNGIIISNADMQKLTEAANYYYDQLSIDDKEYMECTKDDIFNIFIYYHLAVLAIRQMTKNSDIELSIAETKVIKTKYIVMDDLETAEKVLEGVKGKGANFDYYANTYTKEENKKMDLTIMRGDDMSIVFPEVFYLASGEISNILEYQNRYYIFKCISDYMEKESKERREEILLLLKNKEFNEQYHNYYEKNKTMLGASYWNEIDLAAIGNFKSQNFHEIYNLYLGE